jgi:hypothetical protein
LEWQYHLLLLVGTLGVQQLQRQQQQQGEEQQEQQWLQAQGLVVGLQGCIRSASRNSSACKSAAGLAMTWRVVRVLLIVCQLSQLQQVLPAVSRSKPYCSGSSCCCSNEAEDGVAVLPAGAAAVFAVLLGVGAATALAAAAGQRIERLRL